jgi:hypothetical protein
MSDNPFAFKDGKGRTWSLHVTALTLRDFETRSGIDLIGRVMVFFAGGPQAKTPEEVAAIGMKAGAELFGKLSNLLLLVYLACRDSSGKVMQGSDEIPFDDFCSSIEDLTPLISAGLGATMACFKKVGGDDDEEEGEQKGPFDPSPGTTS